MDSIAFLRKDGPLRSAVLESVSAGRSDMASRLGVGADAVERVVARRGGEASEVATRVEAIVRSEGRPTLLVKDGDYVEPTLAEVRDLLAPHRANIRRAIEPVGRIEFQNYRMPWGGTGWLVEAPAGLRLGARRRLVVTNRHVAELVTRANARGQYVFGISPVGQPFEMRLDLREEYQGSVSREIPCVRVRYLAAAAQPDIAILEVQSDEPLPSPIPMSETAVAMDQLIGVVGYPAYDSRNDPSDVAHYFGDIFDVKRFAFGEVTQGAGTGAFFMHDATTLGGNSGSEVFDLASGKAVGLHFAGQYHEGNYAVTVAGIGAALKGLTTLVSVKRAAAVGGNEAAGDGAHEPAYFAKRDGFRRNFLGVGKTADFPGFGPWASDISTAANADGSTSQQLRYRHFSVVMSKTRKLPLVTGVNIDGRTSKRIPRAGDAWSLDKRVPLTSQLDNATYKNNAFDRGHMVRREDPVWGSAAIAAQANEDTFHYTNAAPQHEDLNQKTWLSLESYVLDNARARNLKVSVFTGPIFRDDDQKYRGVKIPVEYWKAAVVVNDDTGKLSATGYILSQGQLIHDLTESWVFGEFRTYQVSLATIEAATGLDFALLKPFDPLNTPIVEGVAPAVTFIPIDGPESIVFSRG